MCPVICQRNTACRLCVDLWREYEIIDPPMGYRPRSNRTRSAGENVMRGALRTTAAVAVALIATQSLPASAQIQELTIKFIGQSSIESNSALLEKPFFSKMTEKSGGKIK